MLAEAIIAYKRAILVNPKNSSENYNFETAYRAQGRLEEAIAAYRRKSTKATV
jgi:tetratricopeptide (TPR) repeat protein